MELAAEIREQGADIGPVDGVDEGGGHALRIADAGEDALADTVGVGGADLVFLGDLDGRHAVAGEGEEDAAVLVRELVQRLREMAVVVGLDILHLLEQRGVTGADALTEQGGVVRDVEDVKRQAIEPAIAVSGADNAAVGGELGLDLLAGPRSDPGNLLQAVGQTVGLKQAEFAGVEVGFA